MTKRAATPEDADLKVVLGDLIQHAEHLLSLQGRLLREEVGHELRNAAGTAAALGAGAGLLAAAGLLSTQAVVHLLRRATGLPLWACYALAAAGCGAAGVKLLADGRDRAAALARPPLPQTTATLKENLTWLKDQATAAEA